MIIHIRLSGLELFTFVMDSLIEVKLRYISCRIIQICKGGGGRKSQSQTAGSGSAVLCNITATLTLQRTKKVRKLWQLSHEYCPHSVTTSLNIFCPILSWGLWLRLQPFSLSVRRHTSGDGWGDTSFSLFSLTDHTDSRTTAAAAVVFMLQT